nr:non-ribosomal peptide synthetase [Rhodococcus sp. T7]
MGAALDAQVPVRTIFEASTVHGLAARVESHAGAGGRVPLVARERSGRVPLSLAQSRMWFLNRFEPESAAYNIPVAIRLVGVLDVAALRAAVGDVVGRHEALRTVYPETVDGPVQEIVSAAEVVPDLTPVVVAEDQVLGRVVDLVSAGFDVTAGVPVRAALFRVAEDEFVLALVVHHISADGFSMGPLTRDVMVAYAARVRGEVPGWAPLEVQYADFALWQREVLGSEDDPASLISQQIRYWKSALAGLPDQLDLPMDRPRPVNQSLRGGRAGFEVDARLHQGLLDVARAHNSTLFMVVHTGLAVLLSRLSGTDDIAIGTPIAGRGEQVLDDLIGMFVNTVVFRTQVDSGCGFDDLLARARETDLSAFAHADVPFERLVEALNPVRSTARHPLFQVGLSFQNLASTQFELPGLRVWAVDADTQISQFDLHLIVADRYDDEGRAAGLGGFFTYATDLFDESTVVGFVERFVRILEAVVNDPSVVVGDIDILDAPERVLVLEGANATRHEVAGAGTLVDLFDAQVSASPDSVAVVFEDERMTYAELDARVNSLARHLISIGVGPESLVGLAIRRSTELLVGMYAVAKAGGAYVPLDPDQPVERIEHVLDTALPVCVLSTSRDSFALSGQGSVSVPVVHIDVLDASGLSAAPVRSEERVSPLCAQNTAYVIFTSGSTGRPKGVAVSHGAIVNQLEWKRARYELGEADAVLLKTAATFDLSVWEFWSALVSGARVVIAAPEGHRDPGYLNELMRAHAVTVLHVVPSMLDALLTDAWIVGLPESLRTVLAIGEALPAATAARLRRSGRVQLVNLYGPTEAAVSVTAHDVLDADTVTVPIGVPEWNTQAYVLDSRLHPVPVGIAGELYLAGAQLARGYVGRADLTAERFVANPFGDSGERLYRTGDLVSWRVDGELEYVGRTDFQVKVRGFRIELGEIEAVLASHTSVSQVVVIVRSDSRAGDQLVAYAVPSTGRVVDVAELKSLAGQSLPSYMVPAAFVALDALPLTANGKLDRKALPAPEFVARVFRAPSTPVEKTVAATFAEVLGVERIGLDDDFFELGGNSLIATQVATRLGAALGIAVPVRLLFTYPSVGGLADRITDSEAEAGDTDRDAALQVLLPLSGGSGSRPLFCMHPMLGLSWCYSGLSQYLDPEQSVFGLQLPAITEDSPLAESIQEMAARYSAEIRRVQPHGPYRILGWSLGGVVAHAVAVHLQSQGEEVESLVLIDAILNMVDRELWETEFRDVLRTLGLNINEGEDLDLSVERAQQLLDAVNGGEASLTVERVQTIFTATMRTPELIRNHRPSTFRGDLLFFSGVSEGPSGAKPSEDWRPHITGTVQGQAVPFVHGEMMAPESLAVIGPILNEYLTHGMSDTWRSNESTGETDI